MYIHYYPVTNFRCPACGTKMLTEQFRGGKPWICSGCSKEWQFSKTRGIAVQLCSWGVVLIGLYAVGFRGWELLLLALVGGVLLTIIIAGPLTQIFPPPLEAYEAPFWTLPKLDIRSGSVLGLSRDRDESGDAKNIAPTDQDEPKTPVP